MLVKGATGDPGWHHEPQPLHWSVANLGYACLWAQLYICPRQCASTYCTQIYCLSWTVGCRGDGLACPKSKHKSFWACVGRCLSGLETWTTHLPKLLNYDWLMGKYDAQWAGEGCRSWWRACLVVYGPITRYVKLWVAHAPGMPGTNSPPSTSKEMLVGGPSMHQGTCVMHVPWCMFESGVLLHNRVKAYIYHKIYAWLCFVLALLTVIQLLD